MSDPLWIGPPISFECTRVAATDPMRQLTESGLDGSLYDVLRAEGLVPEQGEEWVELGQISEVEAAVLGRTPGERFLRARRLCRDRRGVFVEHTESLLDPDRFRLRLKFGGDGVSRALAAFTGLAIGDALGMPTQSLPREAIQARYGVLTGFEPGPADQPIAPGMAAGSITDDTEQAVLVARLLIAGDGHVDAAPAGGRSAGVGRGHAPPRLAGPARAVDQGRGAARWRRARAWSGPAGSARPTAPRCESPLSASRTAADDLPSLVDSVVEASWVTHNTGVALSGAAAVAAAVSAGIAGATVAEATKVAAEAAGLASGRGNWIAAGDVGTRLAWASEVVEDLPPGEAADTIYRLVGTSVATQESVPAAFAVLAVHPDDPWRACLLAASLGGDCDTIAAIVGAIAGACHGDDAFPDEAVRTIHAVNDLPLAGLTAELLALRG